MWKAPRWSERSVCFSAQISGCYRRFDEEMCGASQYLRDVTR
jgi:hypothetical protein